MAGGMWHLPTAQIQGHGVWLTSDCRCSVHDLLCSGVLCAARDRGGQCAKTVPGETFVSAMIKAHTVILPGHNSAGHGCVLSSR